MSSRRRRDRREESSSEEEGEMREDSTEEEEEEEDEESREEISDEELESDEDQEEEDSDEDSDSSSDDDDSDVEKKRRRSSHKRSHHSSSSRHHRHSSHRREKKKSKKRKKERKSKKKHKKHKHSSRSRSSHRRSRRSRRDDDSEESEEESGDTEDEEGSTEEGEQVETDGDGGDTPELPSIDQEEFILEKPQPIVIEDDDDEEPEMRRVVRKKGRGAFEEEPRKRTKEEEEFQDQEDYLRAMRMRRVEAEKDTRPERRPPATREDSHSASSRRGDRSSRDGDSSSRQDLPRGRRDRDPDRSERSRSPRSRNRGHRSSRTPPPPPSRDTPPPPPAQPEERSATGGASETISLSIEETNALRASLGMAPLKIAGQEGSSGMTAQERDELEDMAEKAGGTLIEGSNKNEVHKPAENLAQKSLAEKMRERLAQRREKRKQEAKLMMVKGLGEASDSDHEGSSKRKSRSSKGKSSKSSSSSTTKGGSGSKTAADDWVERQKRIQKEKQEAAKRAKMLEDLDDEFGVGNLVQEEVKKDQARQYSNSNLSGLKVEHSTDRFGTGQSVILTLKDSDILDEAAEDTLVNVNIMDQERLEKKKEEAKKAKAGYNAYEMEEVDPLTGEVRRKNMLDKYDEEIDGAKMDAFTIGASGVYNEEEEIKKQKESIKAKLAAKVHESLDAPALRVASDYFTAAEMAAAKFKKPKKKKDGFGKKKKLKKRTEVLKADDLLALGGGGDDSENFGSRNRRKGGNKGEKEKNSDSINRGGMLPMDLDEGEEDLDANAFQVKVETIKEDLDELEGDSGLEKALAKARRLKELRSESRKNTRGVFDPAELVARQVKEEVSIKEETEEQMAGSEFISTFVDDLPVAGPSSNIILNETAEFCRNLGARQYNDFEERKKANNARKDEDSKNVDDELLDFEESLKSKETRQYEESRGRWEEVDEDFSDEDRMDVDDDDDTDTEDNPRASRISGMIKRGKKGGASGSKTEKSAILEEEPDLQNGVAAAIKLAESMGYWDKDKRGSKGDNLKHLQAKNYTIDDKMGGGGGGDDRGRHQRFNGPSQPFAEKAGYVPNVQLEYIDDGGRLMNQKEAFRYLSHKFHGKGSGKLKTEKRMKKVMEDSLMKNMSSTDTPLNTLEKLKKKQKQCSTHYIVLSGNKINPQDLKK